jgi:small subunit ribosomal protein S2
MSSLPDIVILVGQLRELNAVKECVKLGIPLITILDTNCDPTLTDLLVPANDDSVASVSLILNEFSKALSK